MKQRWWTKNYLVKPPVNLWNEELHSVVKCYLKILIVSLDLLLIFIKNWEVQKIFSTYKTRNLTQYNCWLMYQNIMFNFMEPFSLMMSAVSPIICSFIIQKMHIKLNWKKRNKLNWNTMKSISKNGRLEDMILINAFRTPENIYVLAHMQHQINSVLTLAANTPCRKNAPI